LAFAIEGSCFMVLSPTTLEVRGGEHDEQVRAQLIANEAMTAALYCRDSAADGSKKSSEEDNKVNIQRIGCKSVMTTAVEKASQRLGELLKKHDEALTKADGIAAKEPEQEDNVVKIKGDLNQKFDEARKQLEDSYVKHISGSLMPQADACQTTEALALVRTALSDHMKTMNQNKVRDFTDYIKYFNLTSGALGRKVAEDAGKKRKADDIAERPKPPIWEALFALVEGSYNVGDSVFECKGGFRPALLLINDRNLFEELKKQPLAKKAFAAMAKAIKSGTSSVVQPLDGGKVIVKRYNTLIGAAVGQEVRSECVLPKAGWSSQVFLPEMFGTGPVDLNANWNTYGMMSTYIIFEGDIVLCGFPNDKLEGVTFKDKRNNVLTMSPSELATKIQDGGWMARATDGTFPKGQCCIAIPSGFLILFASRNVKALRWPFCADAQDLQRVKYTLTGMLDSFPEMRVGDQPNVELAQHLGCAV
jgi:hypothetical protein